MSVHVTQREHTHLQFTEHPRMSSLSLRVRDCRGKEWENVDPTEKERIEVKCVEDGEFW